MRLEWSRWLLQRPIQAKMACRAWVRVANLIWVVSSRFSVAKKDSATLLLKQLATRRTKRRVWCWANASATSPDMYWLPRPQQHDARAVVAPSAAAARNASQTSSARTWWAVC